MIEGTMMWEKVDLPTKRRRPRSFDVFPSVPPHKLLLTAPDRVNGGASSAGMWLHMPRLRKLV